MGSSQPSDVANSVTRMSPDNALRTAADQTFVCGASEPGYLRTRRADKSGGLFPVLEMRLAKELNLARFLALE